MMPFRAMLHFVARHKRALVLGASILCLVSAVTLVAARLYSAARAGGEIYTLDAVPEKPVAIVFGALVQANGRLSAMLADRVRMGAELYRAGKVKALLLTGDNHVETYNEPEAMRQYALRQGVPDSALVLDYAGFRTYDSCYRARDVFKVNQAILVTQAFHMDRALLTCNELGVDSVGVTVDALRPDGYSRSALLRSEVREFPSTALALLDVAGGKKPTYLGDPLPIFSE